MNFLMQNSPDAVVTGLRCSKFGCYSVRGMKLDVQKSDGVVCLMCHLVETQKTWPGLTDARLAATSIQQVVAIVFSILINEWPQFDHSIVDASISQGRCLNTCVRVRGAHFQHKFWQF